MSIRKHTCKSCGMAFELVDLPQGGTVPCPGCFSPQRFEAAQEVVHLGGYRLIDLLGQGGMGQVFRGVGPDGREVAVKVMSEDLMESPELRERFDRETAIMASLNHPNIVPLLESGETGNFKFFVMELISGSTLRQIISQRRLQEGEICCIMLQIFDALGYAHTNGVIHRDIKPENVLFDSGGRPRLTDFGLARRGGSSSAGNLTATNAVMGTENYMSPEQRINPRDVSHKSDLYSMGVMLYEMLTGGQLPMGLFQPPSVYGPNLDSFWDALTFRMLDINPDLRPSNCQEVIDEINRFIAQGKAKPLDSEVLSPPPKKSPTGQRKTPDSMGQDRLDQDSQRLNKRVEAACQEALGLAGEKRFQEAVGVIEPLMGILDDPVLRDRVKHLVDEIRNHWQNESRKADILTFLCPECRRPFELPIEQTKQPEWPCPLCREPLRYDAGRKQVLRLQPVKKTPSPAEEPERKNVSQTGQRSSTGKTILFVLVLVVVTDTFAPDLLNGALEKIFDLGLKSVVPFSYQVAAIYLRQVLQVGLIGSLGWTALQLLSGKW